MDIRVLITGAAGFFGSHLCDRFIKEGCHSFYDLEAGYLHVFNTYEPRMCLNELDNKLTEEL